MQTTELNLDSLPGFLILLVIGFEICCWLYAIVSFSLTRQARAIRLVQTPDEGQKAAKLESKARKAFVSSVLSFAWLVLMLIALAIVST